MFTTASGIPYKSVRGFNDACKAANLQGNFLGEIFIPHPKGECLDPRNLLKTRCGEVAEWPKAAVC